MWYQSIPFFRSLDEEEGRELVRISRTETFEPGQRILEEGTPGRGLYVIQQGEVVVQKKTPGAEPEVLARLQVGEFFGEMSLVTDLTTAAEAVATERTTALFLPKKDLFSLLSAVARAGTEDHARVRARAGAQALRGGRAPDHPASVGGLSAGVASAAPGRPPPIPRRVFPSR